MEVALTAFGAMTKILVVSIVGVVIAIYPRGNPTMPKEAMQHMSRVSSWVFLPFLILYSMANGLTPKSLAKSSILILFSLVGNVLGFAIARCFEWVHCNRRLGRVVTIACGTPNQVLHVLFFLFSLSR